MLEGVREGGAKMEENMFNPLAEKGRRRKGGGRVGRKGVG